MNQGLPQPLPEAALVLPRQDEYSLTRSGTEKAIEDDGGNLVEKGWALQVNRLLTAKELDPVG